MKSSACVTLTMILALAFAAAANAEVTSVTVQVKFRPTHAGDIRSVLYARSGTTTQLVAYPVISLGSGPDLHAGQPVGFAP